MRTRHRTAPTGLGHAGQLSSHDLRRLRRDLHDSIGPLLAAVTMRSEAARAIMTHDPERAWTMLGELHADACHALDEVRRLASPAAARRDDTCLISALQHQAGRFGRASGGELDVSVAIAPATAAAPPAVQTALYRIATEALTNTARHARAASCSIRIWADSDGYCLEVIDDGTGVSRRRSRGAGAGLHNMRDRAAELGGRCLIENVVPHGTRVYVVLPRPVLPRSVARRGRDRPLAASVNR